MELQTRTGATTTPNDGTWEAWKPSGTSTETQLTSLDSELIVPTGTGGTDTLKFTSANTATTSYVYWKTLADSTVLATGDTFEYDVFLADNADSVGGIDVRFTDTTYARDVAGWTDQNAVSCHPAGSIKSYAYGKWFTRKCTVPSGLNGKTISWIDLVNEDNSLTEHTTYYDNFVIKNSAGTLRTTIYTSGSPTYNVADFSSGNTSASLITYGDMRTVGTTIDTTTKIEGTASEKIAIGAPQVDAFTRGVWHLEETSGNANDSSGNANTLTANNTPGSIDGFYGKGRSFVTASTKYFSCTDAACGGTSKLDIGSSAWTAEAWIKTSTTGAYQGIVSKMGAGGGDLGWTLRVNSSNQAIIGVSLDGTAWTSNPSTSTVTDGKWHHIVGTYTPSTNLKIYVDGVNEATNTTTIPASVFNTTGQFTIGSTYSTGAEPFDGSIDEAKISNVARSADEIAEAYRAGRDHRVSKTITSTDMSNKTKLPFYFASDRPGTFAEATIGETAYANYEPDANTKGLWHLEEDLGSADTSAFLKDSSGNGANMDPGTGTAYPAFVQGKIGKARYFDGGDSASATVTDPAYVNTLDVWIKPTSSAVSKTIATNLTTNASSQPVYGGCTGTALTLDVWTHIAAVSTSSTSCSLYQNGVLSATGATGVTYGVTVNAGATSFIGTIDEVRLSNTTRSANEIRQAYEVGKRTHQITNDFVTTPQAAYTSGTSVTINNPYGTTNLTDTFKHRRYDDI